MKNGNMKFSEIVDAFENAGVNVQSYSGRGMYGKKCLGVDSSHVANTILDTIDNFIDSVEPNSDGLDKVGEFIRMLKDSRTDSMGLGKILYFPSIEWQDDEASGDEDGDYE